MDGQAAARGAARGSTRGAKHQVVVDDGEGRYCDYLAGRLETQAFASKGDRTKFRLKIAAARALEEIGYQALKVSDVCAYADVALGTFYVYFRDKNDIAIEVVLEFVDHLYERAKQVSRGTGEFEAIYYTNRFFISAYKANAGLMQCHVQLQTQVPEFRDLWQPRHFKWIEKLARSIARRGRVEEDTPGSLLQMARALEGMVFHYLYAVIINRDPAFTDGEVDDDEVAMMLSTLWYRAVYCKDPPAT
ncbi:TetR/AcrR family transcriptional regulator [Microbaculum marinum]|uniref:TetR/AcrR family transcriptional regulator n=1 Tax=Microbaculum marinum TaxID=1764581 RepID=A0AAW9RQP9_9HYPH